MTVMNSEGCCCCQQGKNDFFLSPLMDFHGESSHTHAWMQPEPPSDGAAGRQMNKQPASGLALISVRAPGRWARLVPMKTNQLGLDQSLPQLTANRKLTSCQQSEISEEAAVHTLLRPPGHTFPEEGHAMRTQSDQNPSGSARRRGTWLPTMLCHVSNNSSSS